MSFKMQVIINCFYFTTVKYGFVIITRRRLNTYVSLTWNYLSINYCQYYDLKYKIIKVVQCKNTTNTLFPEIT